MVLAGGKTVDQKTTRVPCAEVQALPFRGECSILSASKLSDNNKKKLERLGCRSPEMKEPENLSREDQTVVLFEFGGNGEAAAALVRSLRGRSNSSIADKLTFQDGLRMEKEATTPEYKTGRRRTKKDLTCPREKLY